MQTWLLHDCAFGISRRSLEVVKGLLREEEWADFMNEVYQIALEELGRCEERLARQEARLRPVGDGK